MGVVFVCLWYKLIMQPLRVLLLGMPIDIRRMHDNYDQIWFTSGVYDNKGNLDIGSDIEVDYAYIIFFRRGELNHTKHIKSLCWRYFIKTGRKIPIIFIASQEHYAEINDWSDWDNWAGLDTKDYPYKFVVDEYRYDNIFEFELYKALSVYMNEYGNRVQDLQKGDFVGNYELCQSELEKVKGELVD